MFRLSNTPTVPLSDDDLANDMDEPPDVVPEIISDSQRHAYSRTVVPPPYSRRESLLTKAIHAGSARNSMDMTSSSRSQDMARALSTTSSQSVPSTAELTSDCEMTSPTRSASPSPPPPASHLAMSAAHKPLTIPANKVIIAPVTKDDKPAVVDVGEAAVEKTLGRKRCIMFACADKPAEPTTRESSGFPAVSPTTVTPTVEPQPRKCRLTFVCPSRQDQQTSHKDQKEAIVNQVTSPVTSAPKPPGPVTTSQSTSDLPIPKPVTQKPTSQAFHEFGSSQDDTDSWVDQPSGNDRPKLTLKDVMRKENAIRQIAEEAEAEAAEEEEEELEENELEVSVEEDIDAEDDFAPSDDEDKSDGGNESDDENGFADSDDESDAGSEYLFWAPANATTATSTDNLTHFSARQRSRSSSLDSTPSQQSELKARMFHPRRASKAKPIRMRPGTPELPDSTDFVCGTLDEDRPLEAAYISFREQKKREKHIPIPQDIDPSFPTTDPEEEEDEEDLAAEESEPGWLRDHFGAMDEDDRGRRRPSAIKVSPPQRLPLQRLPQPPKSKAAVVKRFNRSPPPPQRMKSPAPVRRRSPPPRRLFGHSPTRRPSLSPTRQYRSPRGSPTNLKLPLGITINRLAQRPTMDRTASLPHTPNPFFRNWKRGSPVTSCIPSGAVTPGNNEPPRPDLHVRGPVDIVIGLEKKRQKRKEKYWRQHCRKVAKEQSERKTAPGRGVERMKELGLECAERTRGYGLGQQAKLVLSL